MDEVGEVEECVVEGEVFAVVGDLEVEEEEEVVTTIRMRRIIVKNSNVKILLKKAKKILQQAFLATSVLDAPKPLNLE